MPTGTRPKYAVSVSLSLASTEFCKIPQKQKFRENRQIRRLGSKFCILQKTVGPSHLDTYYPLPSNCGTQFSTGHFW